MPWPSSAASAIFERFAGFLEARITRLKPDIDAKALSRATRSRSGMFAQVGRAVSLETKETHDHLAYVGRQLFIDACDDDNVQVHADMWGKTARDATPAVGTVLIEGAAGTVLPAELELSTSDAQTFLTQATATIGVGGSVSVRVQAVTSGLAGNVEAGIRMATVEPYPQISRVTVEEPGLAGGADAASLNELRSAVQTHIRQRPHGGAGFDYPVWLADEFAVRAVSVVPEWIGRGSVGVVVAMTDGNGAARIPNDTEIDAMQAHLGLLGSQTGMKPVTAHVIVLACVLRSIPISVRLRPDTVATRAAVTEAFARFIATLGDADDPQNASPIGAVIEPSRLSEALSAASGEYGHDLVVPASRLTLAPREYPVAGVITWLEAT